MKLQNKVLIVTGLAVILFLFFSYFNVIRDSFISMSVLTIFIFATLVFLTYAFIINRIEKLNKQLDNITSATQTSKKEIVIEGSDEFSHISNKINLFLDNQRSSINLLDKKIDGLEKEVEDAKQELLNANIELKQKIAEHSTVDKSFTDHRENITKIQRHDILTELPNRILFNEALNKTISHAKRHNKIAAVLIINLDAFRDINTAMGRATGDFVLKRISKRFTKALRAEDMLARLEGDEFIVLLNDIEQAKFASVVAEKLLAACSKPIKEFFVTASIGISIYPNDGESLEDLLNNADMALYKAKSSGGNSYQFYTEQMHIEASEYLQLGAALREAIENEELTLYFQPKLHIKTGTIIGAEALIRWIHPELGIITPAKFIPVAEETGLIMQLGEWALRKACKTNKTWQDEGYEHLTVAVNISPKQFYHPEIATIITNVLNESGLNPQYLELEINEATVMDDIDKAMAALDRIKATGVQISIDHFGTGYTSISHLKRFPVSAVKIDQSFIKGVPNNPNDTAITNAFIALAHNLGIEVVAEGVETSEQMQYLSIQNCDVIQGYFISHPLPAQKIVQQFKKLMDRVLLG
ncbi:MAG: EAL domain-containing protein [Gammaproteobacteria bacterium]